jgi:hypothetical protein
MNFTDSSSDNKVGTKTAERKSNDNDVSVGASHLDKELLKGAEKANDRTHHNEQTNSSNTTFSK